MAIVMNAKGTTSPYFKIGKQGTNIFQGSSDPSGSYTTAEGDMWIDTSNKVIKFRNSSNNGWTEASVDSSQYVDGSIDTAHIADDQITLAKMASGTDGNIISYDASGNPVAIATGSDGQVLTSTGAGSPPAFEDASGGGVTSLVENNSIWLGNDPSGTTDTASYNVAVGTTALDAITTGDNNTALGYNSLSTNTTGQQNTAVGSIALDANTTGTDNAALGSYTLYANTTASYNTAVGANSLYSNTTGANNSATGYQALNANTTGSYNSATGAFALYANTTASYNTATGTYALRYNTTGALNIGIGYGAGDAITTGSNNTIIGDYAGTTGLADTVVITAGTTERIKVNSTGLYVNGTLLGGAALEMDFVASGTLPNGKSVILNSDGTVTVVEVVAASAGSAATTVAGNDGSVAKLSDTTFVMVGNTSSGAAAWLGTVSGGSISFGSSTVWGGGTEQYVDNVTAISATQFVVAYGDYGNSNRGKAVVGTVSGGSISFGTVVTFETGQTSPNHGGSIIALSSTKVVIVYEDASNSSYATAIVGTISGTSISFGTATVFNSANSSKFSIVNKLTSTSVIICYSETPSPNPEKGKALVGTISGTSISFGSQVTYETDRTIRHTVAVLTPTTFVISYQFDRIGTMIGKSVVGTISGTTITMGSPVTFYASSLANQFFGSERISDTEFAISWKGDSGYGVVIFGTVSGTSISFEASAVFYSASVAGEPVTPILLGDSDLVIGFDATLHSAVDYTLETINLTATNFVGTSTAAYTNGETATIVLQGGVSTNQSSLTIGSTYYVQTDGTLATTADSVVTVVAGKALSTTTLLLKGV